jgi:hypothetical protein
LWLGHQQLRELGLELDGEHSQPFGSLQLQGQLDDIARMEMQQHIEVQLHPQQIDPQVVLVQCQFRLGWNLLHC